MCSWRLGSFNKPSASKSLKDWLLYCCCKHIRNNNVYFPVNITNKIARIDFSHRFTPSNFPEAEEKNDWVPDTPQEIREILAEKFSELLEVEILDDDPDEPQDQQADAASPQEEVLEFIKFITGMVLDFVDGGIC